MASCFYRDKCENESRCVVTNPYMRTLKSRFKVMWTLGTKFGDT